MRAAMRFVASPVCSSECQRISTARLCMLLPAAAAAPGAVASSRELILKVRCAAELSCMQLRCAACKLAAELMCNVPACRLGTYRSAPRPTTWGAAWTLTPPSCWHAASRHSRCAWSAKTPTLWRSRRRCSGTRRSVRLSVAACVLGGTRPRCMCWQRQHHGKCRCCRGNSNICCCSLYCLRLRVHVHTPGGARVLSHAAGRAARCAGV